MDPCGARVYVVLYWRGGLSVHEAINCSLHTYMGVNEGATGAGRVWAPPPPWSLHPPTTSHLAAPPSHIRVSPLVNLDRNGAVLPPRCPLGTEYPCLTSALIALKAGGSTCCLILMVKSRLCGHTETHGLCPNTIFKGGGGHFFCPLRSREAIC